MRQLAFKLHTFRLSRLRLWFEGLICHASGCLVLKHASFILIGECDASSSLSSESAITVLWIWLGMAIPWYRFLNERVTFSIAFVCAQSRLRLRLPVHCDRGRRSLGRSAWTLTLSSGYPLRRRLIRDHRRQHPLRLFTLQAWRVIGPASLVEHYPPMHAQHASCRSGISELS
jgi:hypothetical protein